LSELAAFPPKVRSAWLLEPKETDLTGARQNSSAMRFGSSSPAAPSNPGRPSGCVADLGAGWTQSRCWLPPPVQAVSASGTLAIEGLECGRGIRCRRSQGRRRSRPCRRWRRRRCRCWPTARKILS